MWTVALYSMVHIVHMCALCCVLMCPHECVARVLAKQPSYTSSEVNFHRRTQYSAIITCQYHTKLIFISIRVVWYTSCAMCIALRFGSGVLYIYISVYMTGVCALCTSIQMRLEAMKSQTIQNIPNMCVLCCMWCSRWVRFLLLYIYNQHLPKQFRLVGLPIKDYWTRWRQHLS